MNLKVIKGALAGKILRVDLTAGTISTEDTIKYARRFIGGRTINSYILLNEISPQVKWSDPENLLIFGAGCLTGTMAPGACRLSIDCKNVFNNAKGSANAGGDFASEMKFAGFDHIVFSGKSEKPVYLWLHDGRAELRDASDIWGKTTYETEEILQKELGGERVKVASIGPAGENLVKGSAIMVDCCKAAGGSGVGCVMGNKKLKAVAALGNGAIQLAQPDRFMAAVSTALKKIMASSHSIPHRKGNVESGLLPGSPIWDGAPVLRNGQDDYWPLEKQASLCGLETGVPRFKKKMTACITCPTGCMPFYQIDEGKHHGLKGTGYWINSALYSVRLDVSDPADSLKFHLLANQLGLDGDMAAVVLSWAFECYERGLLTKKDTDGLALDWGDGEAVLEMERRLAYREGLGNLLADGVKIASEKLGCGSEKFAIHMKGQDTFDGYRIMKGFGLGVATSPVAGRHLRGAVVGPGISGPRELSFYPDKYENQPEAVFWQVRMKELEDMTGICNFMGSWTGAHALEAEDYAEMLNAAMGIEVTGDELMQIGQRGYNLEKAFNTLHTGFTRQDDLPPRRYIEEPVKSGRYAGYRCDPDKWAEMLDRFYDLQGWDKKTSWQTRQCLSNLGLEDIAQKLVEAGRLKG